jgi:16S rRNA (guanine1207-N2)-methyltransferase
MSRDALKTLFHPFETGVVPAPGEGERVLFLGAEAGYRLPAEFAGSIAAVQGSRPLYRAMTRRLSCAASTRARTKTASPRR